MGILELLTKLLPANASHKTLLTTAMGAERANHEALVESTSNFHSTANAFTALTPSLSSSHLTPFFLGSAVVKKEPLESCLPNEASLSLCYFQGLEERRQRRWQEGEESWRTSWWCYGAEHIKLWRGTYHMSYAKERILQSNTFSPLFWQWPEEERLPNCSLSSGND